nr:nuclear poly(A) polymerase 4-like isoform X1 [Tanacetum cinerariifolium]
MTKSDQNWTKTGSQCSSNLVLGSWSWADIDTLCVGLSYVNRDEDFFVLHEMLMKIEEVTELQPVPSAHVPVMKFKYDGISIDLLYASISHLVIPDVDIVAADPDDLRAWKGWVESRLRQLTLMCSHSDFLMGLQGEIVQEGQQFDIRADNPMVGQKVGNGSTSVKGGIQHSVGLCADRFSWGPAVGGEGACTSLTLPNVEISRPLLV